MSASLYGIRGVTLARLGTDFILSNNVFSLFTLQFLFKSRPKHDMMLRQSSARYLQTTTTATLLLLLFIIIVIIIMLYISIVTIIFSVIFYRHLH